MCIKNLEKCNKIMHVAKRNVILLYFSKLQIQYATNFYMNLFHIIDTYTKNKCQINKKCLTSQEINGKINNCNPLSQGS